MSVAAINSKARGSFVSVLRLLGVAVSCSLLMGCATSSPEDDYVSGILADAMQGASGGDVTSLAATDTTPLISPVSAPPAEVVPEPVPAVVSVAPPALVSVPPAATVSTSPTATVSVSVAKPVTPAVAMPATVHPEPPAAAVSPVTTAPTSFPDSSNPQPTVPTIQPDSVLWVSVSEDPSLNGRYMVSEASAIDFGYVGLVFLQDMKVEQAEAELKRVLEGRYLKNATVSVKLAKASYDRIGVLGAIAVPGDIKIGPGATVSLSEALRRAGGVRGDKENSRVKVVRGGLKTPFGPAAEGDVYSLVTRDGQLRVPEVFLRNDDLAYVFSPSMETPQGTLTGAGRETVAGSGRKRVILLGEVPRRGVVEFAENEPCTLMYLLFKVGGLPRFAKANKITVVRRNKDGTEKSFLVDGEKLLSNGKPEDDIALENGDRIVVPARKISFF